MFMSRAGIEEECRTEWRCRLIEGAATKPVTTDLLLIEVDLAMHEPVGPGWIDPQQMAEHFHRSRFARASPVNDAPRGSGLPIELICNRNRSFLDHASFIATAP
jgi:hypothetical protein